MPRPYKSAIKSNLQKEIDIEVGKRLRQARASRGFDKKIYDASGCIVDIKRVHKPCTQTELAKVLDCTFQQIQKFEHGRNTLSLFKIFLAAKFFKLDVKEFTNFYQKKLYPSIEDILLKDIETKLANALTPPKTFQQIQKYEKGQNGVSTIILLQISKFFNKPLDYFTSEAQELVGQHKPPINSSKEDRDCSLSQEL